VVGDNEEECEVMIELAIIVMVCGTLCYVVRRVTWVSVETDKDALHHKAEMFRLEAARDQQLLGGKP
jgi:hypothetical protein